MAQQISAHAFAACIIPSVARGLAPVDALEAARPWALPVGAAVVVAALVLAILFMLSALAVPFAALLSMALALFAAVVQRWLFFAEAKHVVSLYY